MYASYVPKHLTDPLWQRLSDTRIFITGGTGLFGQWLLDSLSEVNQRLDLNISASVLTRRPELAKAKMPYLSSRIQFVAGQVENFAFPSEKYDYLLHMATTSAEETFNGFSQTLKFKMLYEGTKRVIEFADKANVKRVLFTSSGAVYGSQQCDHIQESALMQIEPLNPESALALGKSVSEFLLKQASSDSDLAVVIARCFSFVGPGIPMDLHYAIGNFIKNANEGKPILIKGDGTPIRSYMFMGDLVWWLLQLLLDGKSGEAYNVGSDQSLSILDLAHKVSELNHSKSKVVTQGKSTYSVGVPTRNAYFPSIEKAKDHLGLEIYTDLNQAILSTLTYLNSPCKS